MDSENIARGVLWTISRGECHEHPFRGEWKIESFWPEKSKNSPLDRSHTQAPRGAGLATHLYRRIMVRISNSTTYQAVTKTRQFQKSENPWHSKKSWEKSGKPRQKKLDTISEFVFYLTISVNFYVPDFSFVFFQFFLDETSLHVLFEIQIDVWICGYVGFKWTAYLRCVCVHVMMYLCCMSRFAYPDLGAGVCAEQQAQPHPRTRRASEKSRYGSDSRAGAC